MPMDITHNTKYNNFKVVAVGLTLQRGLMAQLNSSRHPKQANAELTRVNKVLEYWAQITGIPVPATHKQNSIAIKEVAEYLRQARQQLQPTESKLNRTGFRRIITPEDVKAFNSLLG
jgi:hypothetical protein